MKNKTKEKLHLLRSKALLLSMLASVGLLSGCTKSADCDIEDNHTHVYVNSEGYKRNINSEKLRIDGYDRTNEYNLYYDEDLTDFITKKDLLTIDDNINLINQYQSQNNDFIEYRYRYTMRVPIIHRVGKVSYVSYIISTHYSWTSDPNHSGLTGETRYCHPMYQAYKIEKDEKGKFVLIPSELVDDLNDIKGYYPYIKRNYCVVVNSDNMQAIDYEDGQFEDYEEVKEENSKLVLEKGSDR